MLIKIQHLIINDLRANGNWEVIIKTDFFLKYNT